MYARQKSGCSVSSEDGYAQLGNAIILQAVRDYRDAIKKLKRFPYDDSAQCVKSEVESFFRGGLFSVITELSPEMLIRKLNEEVAEHE